MTKERIAELRKETVEFSASDDAFSIEVVTECLDEIERLETENKHLVHALTYFRYSHDEIELSCGGERAMEVREKVMFRRAMIEIGLAMTLPYR